MSYLIVSLTLAVPYMILGETALSFLGLRLRPPVVSWGTLLQDAQNVHAMLLHPWLLIPGLFVVVAVLAFKRLKGAVRRCPVGVHTGLPAPPAQAPRPARCQGPAGPAGSQDRQDAAGSAG